MAISALWNKVILLKSNVCAWFSVCKILSWINVSFAGCGKMPTRVCQIYTSKYFKGFITDTHSWLNVSGVPQGCSHLHERFWVPRVQQGMLCHHPSGRFRSIGDIHNAATAQKSEVASADTWIKSDTCNLEGTFDLHPQLKSFLCIFLNKTIGKKSVCGGVIHKNGPWNMGSCVSPHGCSLSWGLAAASEPWTAPWTLRFFLLCICCCH